jgi:hypothetical protein
MGIQSQQCEGSVKKCKKSATKRQAKHKLRQHAIGAGGVEFFSIAIAPFARRSIQT